MALDPYDAKTETEFALHLKKQADLIGNIYVLSFIAGLFCIIVLAIKNGLSLKMIPAYLFFILNCISIVDWTEVELAIHYELIAIQESEYAESVCKIVPEVKETIKDIFNGLEKKESDIIKPSMSKILNLFISTYDKNQNLKSPDTFHDIKNFLEDFKKTITVYKKGKGVADIEFLEKLSNIAEDFYNNIAPKEQNKRKIEFEAAIETLKIELKKK